MSFDCAIATVLDYRGNESNATADGVGIPEEVNIPDFAPLSLGRFVFWPNGRNTGPKTILTRQRRLDFTSRLSRLGSIV